MSIKELFENKSNGLVTKKDLQELDSVVESTNNIQQKSEVKILFEPHVDYADPSSFVFYGSAKRYYMDALDRIQTLYPYALSKYNGEQAVLHWNNVYKLPVISVRIFNAYGERVRTTGAYGAVFGVFFKQKLEKKPFTIVGDGNQKRDFLYVTDIARAFYELSQSNYENEVYNLGFGKPHTINQLVSIIDKKNSKVFIPKRPGEPDITWANISKIQNHINWVPKISFEEGVNLMIKNLDDWKDAPLWDKDNIELATKTWFKFMSK